MLLSECRLYILNINNYSIALKYYLFPFSVHIKLHVPEILKKHTHVRTIYKHHYKPKPKPKHKEIVHDRLDPSIRSGTLHSRYQAKPHWMDALNVIPRPHHQGSSSADSQEPDILHRWQQNLEMLQPKHKKTKKPVETVIDYPIESDEDEEPEYVTIPVTYHTKQNSRPKKQHRQAHHHPHQKPKNQLINHHHHKPQKQIRPDYMVMDGSLSYAPTAQSERHADIHTAQSLSQSHFKPPRLLKITEDDIRIKLPAKKHHSNGGTGTWTSYEDTIEDAPQKMKLKYEWQAEQVTDMEENQPMMSAVGTDDDEGEFIPFKSSVQMMQQQPNYASGSTQSDEYSSVFGLKPVPVHYHQTHTQRKNKKNVMSNLNTRIMNS